MAVDQHDQRLAPREGGLVRERRKHVYLALLAYLHHWALLGIRADEQRRQEHCLAERPAAVPAKVEHHAVRPLLVEPRHPLRHVERAGAVARLVWPLVHRAVERGQLHVSHHVRDAVQDDLLHAAGRRLVLELDLVADDGHLAARGAVLVGDLEHHLRVLLAADLLDGLAHRLPHHVLDRVVALPDAHDLVALLDAALARHRPALHDLLDLESAVVHGLREHRAHAAEREVHVHVEVVLAHRRHVSRVRVVGHRRRQQVALQHLFVVQLRQHPREVVPILVDHVLLRRRLGLLDALDGVRGVKVHLDICDALILVGTWGTGRPALLLCGLLSRLLASRLLLVVQLAAQDLGKQLVLDALAPYLVALLARRRPWRLLAVELALLLHREVELRRLQHVGDVVHALLEAMDEHLVDVVRERHVPAPERVADAKAQRLKLVKVRLQEHAVPVVVHRNQVGPSPLGDLLAQRLLRHVVRGQHPRDLARDAAVVLLRLDVEVRHRRRLFAPRKRRNHRNRRKLQHANSHNFTFHHSPSP